MLACHQTTRIYANGVAESLLIQPCLTEEWTGNAPLRRAAKNVVPILYRWLDFEAFDDFGVRVSSPDWGANVQLGRPGIRFSNAILTGRESGRPLRGMLW